MLIYAHVFSIFIFLGKSADTAEERALRDRVTAAERVLLKGTSTLLKMGNL